jgi:hypothetical protein
MRVVLSAALAALSWLAGCSLFVPPAVTVSVYASILGDYSSRPVWEWAVSGFNQPLSVTVSLNAGSEIELAATARSYRPNQHLTPGSHTLLVTATFGTFFGPQAQGSATATVATVNALPAFSGPDDPDDFCVDMACGGQVQWALAAHHATELWDALAAGALPALKQVVVAVLDTGYVADSMGSAHEDLDGNLAVGDGYDFIDDPCISADGDGIDSDPTDAGDGTASCGSPGQNHTWHGTAVAGVIAAETDNTLHLAGLGWPWGASAIDVMPVRVLGVGGGTSYDIAQGIRYAAGLSNDSGTTPARPAKILNMSFGGPGTDAIIELALQEAVAVGVIPVVASGNFNTEVFAPANSSYAIAVGAVDSVGQRASFSNFGATLDVVAAGKDVLVLSASQDCPSSCTPWEREPQDGTSFAAPYVAAALALVAAIDPDVTFAEARTMLADSAIDLGPIAGRDDDYGYGNLDLFALLGSYPPRAMADLDPLGSLDSDDVVAGPNAAAGGATAPPPANAAADSLVVEWRDGIADRSIAGLRLQAQSGARAVRGSGRHTLVSLAPGQDREALMALLALDADVAAVFYNRRYQPAGPRAVP